MATRSFGKGTVTFTPTQNQTQMYNMIGRDSGLTYGAQAGGGNLFENAFNGFVDNIKRKAGAAENAIGTTLSIAPAIINTNRELRLIDERNDKWRNNMNDIYKQGGFNSSDDYYNAKDEAERSIYSKYGYDIDNYWDRRAEADANGDNGLIQQLDAERQNIKALMNNDDLNTINRFDNIQGRLQTQAGENMNEARQAAENWRDYRENDYAGKKINQDRGKFLGDALLTESTLVDLAAMGAGLPMGVLANTVQGGVEGVANELSQNGFENFDWSRAGQNALIGAASGAATAGLNKLIPAKGVAQGAKQGLLKTTAKGAGRGALSGAVGGAVGGGIGGGINAAINNQDVGAGILQGTLSGAGQGAVSGAVSGGIMAGAGNIGNRVIDKLGEKGVKIGDTNIADIRNLGQQWKQSGSNFKERWDKAVASGDSIGATALHNLNTNLKTMFSRDNNGQQGGMKTLQGFVTNPFVANDDNEYSDLEQELIDNRRKLRYGRMQDSERQALVKRNDEIIRDMDSRWRNVDETNVTNDYRKLAQELVSQIDSEFGAGTAKDQFSGLDFLTRDGAQFDNVQGYEILKQAADKFSKVNGGQKYADQINNVISQNTTQSSDDYQATLNRALDQGLSGPELGDELAKYSGLPERVDWDDIRTMTGKDQTLSRVINSVENEFIDTEGRAPSPEEVTDLWPEIRARYAQELNYEGPEPSPYTADNRVLTATGTDEQYTFASNDKAPQSIKQAALDYAYETDGRVDPSELTEFYNAAQKFEGDIHSLAEQYSMETDGRIDPDEYVDFMMQSSKTPAQDAYAQGRGSFSDALNEWLEQGGDIVRDKNGKLSIVEPQTAKTTPTTDAFDSLNATSKGKYTGVSPTTRAQKDYTKKQVQNLAKKADYLIKDGAFSGEPSYYSTNDAGQELAQIYAASSKSTNGMTQANAVKAILTDGTPENAAFMQWVDQVQSQAPKMKTKSGFATNLFADNEQPKTDIIKNITGQSQSELRAQALNDYYNQEIIPLSGDDQMIRTAAAALSEADPTFYSPSDEFDDTRMQGVINNAYKKLQNVNTRADVRDVLLANGIGRDEVDYITGAKQYADDMAVEGYAKYIDLYPDDIDNMQVNRNDMLDITTESPETELYRQLTGDSGQTELDKAIQSSRATAQRANSQWDSLANEYGYPDYNSAIRAYQQANPGKAVNAGAVLTWLDNNEGGYNPNALQTTTQDTLAKTSTEGKLRNASGLKLQQQYGTIDKPTAKATNAPETLTKIANQGFTKPADVERMANAITGSNGEVSKLVSSLVANADPVNTFDGENAGQTLQDYIELSVQKHGLDGIREGKAVKSQINALMNSLPSRAEGSITSTDDAAAVFKLTQNLDAEAANYEGRSGLNYGTTNPDKLRAAQVLKDVSGLLKDRIYSGVDVKQALTPEVAENLKSYAPNNEKWAQTVDNVLMKANSVKDLRSFQAPYVRANKIIDNGYINSVTYGGRNSGGINISSFSPKAIAAAVGKATVNSNPGLRAQAKALDVAADVASKVTKPTATAQMPTTATSNPATAVYNALNNTNVNNIIGRNIGEEMGAAQQPIENYIQQAAANTNSAEAGYVQPLGATTSSNGTLESLADTGTTTGTSSTAIANALGSGSNYSGRYSSTGNDQVDLLGRAMELAADANDAAAFGTLYNMYNSALASLQSANSTSELNTTQQNQIAKLQTASDALDELEDLYAGATGAKGPIAGNLQGLAGNIGLDSGASTYNQSRSAIASEIAQAIYGTRSEANIKRLEQQLPQLTDDGQTAANKINSLREMLQKAQQNYYGAYGLQY